MSRRYPFWSADEPGVGLSRLRRLALLIGMASSAPAASVGLTLAALAAATAYGSGPIIVLTAIPMLVIVPTARIVYGMASYRALPAFPGNVSRRFSTPVAASVLVGLGLPWSPRSELREG